MPSRNAQIQLRNLEKHCATLRRQVEALKEQQQSLEYRRHLLDELCESFKLLGACTDDDICPAWQWARMMQLQQLEASLVQQLQAPRPSSSCEVSCDTAEQLQNTHPDRDLGVCTVAPRKDPLAYFKLHFLQPPAPEAASITPADLANILRRTVLEGSVQLHLVQVDNASVQNEATARLDQLWSSYFHLLASLTRLGRTEVVEGLNLYDLSTLQEDPQAVSNHAAQCAALPAVLGLTDQQLSEISAGTALFMGLLKSILAEQQQLQAQISSSSSPSTPCSSTPSSTTTTTISGSMREVFEGCHRDLEAHQRDTGHMQVLLHKEYAVRAAAVGWFVGCLTWEQLTKAAVLSWPYPLRPTLLTQEIARYAAQRIST